MSAATIEGLLWIIVAATIAPILADIIPKITVPVVVLEILIGILFGPQILGWIQHSEGLEIAKEFGVIFLFFLAGFEVDYAGIKGDPLRNALKGWVFSLALALILCFILQQAGLISSFHLVAIAICTTALGPLMPILTDSGQLPTPFGNNVLSIGALGEFLPVLALAFLFNSSRTGFVTALAIIGFFAVSAAALIFFRRVVGQNENSHIRRIAIETLDSSAQFAVRLSILVLVGLVYLAARFDLDVLLGAFAGGFIIGQIGDVASTVESRKVMEWMKTKLEAIGFGVFIPAFFVMTGADFQLDTLFGSTRAMIIVPLTVIAFLVVRGLPVLLGYRAFGQTMRWRLALVASTQLPLVATLMGRFIEGGQVPQDIATAIIGGSVLTVAIFPILAFANMEKPGKRINGNGEEEKVIEALPEMAVAKN